MSATAWLLVLDGPHAGERVRLSRRTVLGRQATADVVLARDITVARQHALVEQGRDGWCLEDLRSPQGTWLNGQKIRRIDALKDGDKIVVGRTMLRFQTREPDVVVSLRRGGDWLHFNPAPGGLRRAISVVEGPGPMRWATWVGHSVMHVIVTDEEHLPVLLDLPEGEAATVLDDVMGVSDQDLWASTPKGVLVEPQLVLEVALRRVELVERAHRMLPMLTWQGRVVVIAELGHSLNARERRQLEMNLLERRLGGEALEHHPALRPSHIALRRAHDADDVTGMLVALREMQELVGGPPSVELVRGLLANLFSPRLADEQRLREEVELLGVEGLLRMVEEAGA